MKIVLFSTPVMDYEQGTLRPIGYDASRECPPYGVYLLATILIRHGYEVVVADLIAEGTNTIAKFSDDLGSCTLVGISATTLSWPTATEVISQLRESAPRVPIVIGGVHPTMFAEYIMQSFPVDYVICGEAEKSFPMLCEAITRRTGFENIPSLVWRSDDGGLISNPRMPRLTTDEISRSPIPDYSILPKGAYKGLSIESSRGCCFDCSFCSATYRGKWVPFEPNRFVDNIERVVRYLDDTKLKLLYIIDDEFSFDPARCIEIANELRNRGLCPRLTYDSRVNDLVHDGLLESISEFTHQILVGAECGYVEGLVKIGKGTTTARIEKAASILAKHGLASKTDFSFIIGLPWETRNEVSKTLTFAAHLLADYGVRLLLQWYVQMPGSRLWMENRRRQVVHGAMYDRYGFFRNLYLFRTANQLLPSEIWEISRAIESSKVLSRLRYPEKQMIEHSLPLQIYENFPVKGLELMNVNWTPLNEKKQRKEA